MIKYKSFKWFMYPLILLVVFAIYLVVENLSGNFHEAIPGELYRSAQLTPGDITYYEKKYHIKSVLNLRGDHTGVKWYDDEVKEEKISGVQNFNFRMSASKRLTKEQAVALIDLMQSMPKPILIHCRSGSDRTGLASALYVAGVKKGSEFDSELQLSILYGHIPLWFTAAYAMNETFEALEPYLGYFDS